MTIKGINYSGNKTEQALNKTMKTVLAVMARVVFIMVVALILVAAVRTPTVATMTMGVMMITRKTVSRDHSNMSDRRGINNNMGNLRSDSVIEIAMAIANVVVMVEEIERVRAVVTGTVMVVE